MSKINLLPWREELNKVRNQQFFAYAVLSVLAGIVFVVLTHLFIEHRIEVEKLDIAYLQQEEKEIIGKVKEIQGLQEAKEALLNRMSVIQSLQSDRVQDAKLMDILPRVTPEGVYLTSLTRKGDTVLATGNAKTNAGIATFLKNLEFDQWGHLFTNPRLNVVKVGTDGSMDFELEFTLGSPKR